MAFKNVCQLSVFELDTRKPIFKTMLLQGEKKCNESNSFTSLVNGNPTECSLRPKTAGQKLTAKQ